MALVGIITLMWMSLLLAISYFVLLTAEKAPEKLKSFGKFVGAVLITVSLVIAVAGISILVTGASPISCPMMGDMQRGRCPMMGGMMKDGKMPCPKMKGGMRPPIKMQEDGSPIKCN
ncbi:MAG TPA: hypothetical protein PLV09_03200 [Candidatus Omnitrophota bacterium]|nr:hypothetical protein [Candidatus Omnitrophota bacterium]HPN66403.1 hypothetical protein [Candidatus Omnitrophota bacterium]HRZ67772.1 hypothetical protein [Candidatus Omnitrophota bacterium]